MAKKVKVLNDLVQQKLDQENATQLAVVEAVQATTKYGIGKLPRNGLHDGTKHGQGGTAGTYAAVVAALKVADGGMDLAAVKAVCVANGDPGFARYAVRNHWLLPVTK